MQDFAIHNATKLTALTILFVIPMFLFKTLLVLWLNCVMYKTQQGLDNNYQLAALVLTRYRTPQKQGGTI
jgi:hypothetical protein